MDLVLPLRSGIIFNGGPRALLLDLQASKGDADVAHLAPVLAPGVAHDPVRLVLFFAPSYHTDDVVDGLEEAFVYGDARLVLEDSTRINPTRNRTARVDLLLHRFLATDGPVVVDRDHGVV